MTREYGSSPLTRGKRERAIQTALRGGLIPAHAGKTYQRSQRSQEPWAHPRSRGENMPRKIDHKRVSGSSPLTRGKRRSARRTAPCVGLIPAHAGKTTQGSPHHANSRAHPRSRGENPLVPEPLPQGEGSSPLTRGKRPVNHARPHFTGLIPAHAGKTAHAWIGPRPAEAHPRSRGENPFREVADPAR